MNPIHAAFIQGLGYTYLSAFYPHLSSDASRDFSSGSSLFLSALRSIASSLPLPPASLPPPELVPLLLLPSSASGSSSSPSAFSFFVWCSSGSSSSSSLSCAGAGCVRGAFYGWGFFCSSGFPFCSDSSFSVPPSALSSQPPAPPFFAPPSAVCSWGTLGLRAPAPVVSAALTFPVDALVAPDPPCPLFHPFSISLPSVSAPVGSAPLGSASVASGFAFAASGFTFAASGFASAPGPSSGLPPRSAAPPGTASSPLSAFAFAPDDPFALGFEDPEAPPPSSAPDSVHAEIHRMYQYLVDLLPQAPPPPRTLFEDFFLPVSTPHQPRQPIYLAWFERVRSALSEANARVALLLASGRSESSLLPPRSAQYAVKDDHALGSTVPVKPSLLAMFDCPLRPSLRLGLTVREAALLEESSCSLLESFSHAMWLLSGLLRFVRLQGFTPSDAALFNTLVTSLSKCLAHQASVAASHTAFVGLKHRQFYLSHLPAYFSEVNRLSMRCWPLHWFARIPYSQSQTSFV